MFIEINVNTVNLPHQIKREWWGNKEKEPADGDIKTLHRIVNSEALEDISMFEELVKLGSCKFVSVYGVRMYGAARNDFGSSKFTEYYKTKEEAEQRYNEILSIVLKDQVSQQKAPAPEPNVAPVVTQEHTKTKRGRKKKNT